MLQSMGHKQLDVTEDWTELNWTEKEFLVFFPSRDPPGSSCIHSSSRALGAFIFILSLALCLFSLLRQKATIQICIGKHIQMMYAYASSVLTDAKQQNLKKWTLYGKGTKNVLNKYKDVWDLIENEVFPVDPRAIDIFFFFFFSFVKACINRTGCYSHLQLFWDISENSFNGLSQVEEINAFWEKNFLHYIYIFFKVYAI